jgi:hypothetical protein
MIADFESFEIVSYSGFHTERARFSHARVIGSWAGIQFLKPVTSKVRAVP